MRILGVDGGVYVRLGVVDLENVCGGIFVGIERDREVLLEVKEDRAVGYVLTAFGAADPEHVVHEVDGEAEGVVVAVIVAVRQLALDKAGLEVARVLIAAARDVLYDRIQGLSLMHPCQNIVQSVFEALTAEGHAVVGLSYGRADLGVIFGGELAEVEGCEIAAGVAGPDVVYFVAGSVFSVGVFDVVEEEILRRAVALLFVKSQDISSKKKFPVIEIAVLFLVGKLPSQGGKLDGAAPPVALHGGSGALDEPVRVVCFVILLRGLAVHFPFFGGRGHSEHAGAVVVVHENMEEFVHHCVGKFNDVFAAAIDDRLLGLGVVGKLGRVDGDVIAELLLVCQRKVYGVPIGAGLGVIVDLKADILADSALRRFLLKGRE